MLDEEGSSVSAGEVDEWPVDTGQDATVVNLPLHNLQTIHAFPNMLKLICKDLAKNSRCQYDGFAVRTEALDDRCKKSLARGLVTGGSLSYSGGTATGRLLETQCEITLSPDDRGMTQVKLYSI